MNTRAYVHTKTCVCMFNAIVLNSMIFSRSSVTLFQMFHYQVLFMHELINILYVRLYVCVFNTSVLFSYSLELC